MGFSWERLQENNPSLIYVSVSGFGHVGRDASYTTWGPSAQAISGATAMSGMADQPPAGWGFSYLDHSAGYYAAIAALMGFITGLGPVRRSTWICRRLSAGWS